MPVTVRAASSLLIADAAIAVAAATAIAGPTVFSRMTGWETLPGASAQAAMVWEAALPALGGAALGFAFAVVEAAIALCLRRPGSIRSGRVAASALAAAAGGLIFLPGTLGMAFDVFAWSGALPGVKHAMLLAALVLLWLPAASREYAGPRGPHVMHAPDGAVPVIGHSGTSTETGALDGSATDDSVADPGPSARLTG